LQKLDQLEALMMNFMEHLVQHLELDLLPKLLELILVFVQVDLKQYFQVLKMELLQLFVLKHKLR
jgi:hypothetical protein